jgi:transporter family protein
MELYIIFAVVAMVGYGVTAILYKIAPNIDAISLTFFSSLSLTFFTFLFWLFNKKEISYKGISIAVIAGLIAAISFLSYVTAIKLGKVSIIAPIRNLSIALTVIIAVLFLAEKLTLIKVVGILLAVVAIVLLSL